MIKLFKKILNKDPLEVRKDAKQTLLAIRTQVPSLLIGSTFGTLVSKLLEGSPALLSVLILVLSLTWILYILYQAEKSINYPQTLEEMVFVSDKLEQK